MFDSRKAVANWNIKAGKTPAPIGSKAYWDGLEAQGKCLLEEAQEFLEAVKNRDLNNLLKEQSDVQVVLDGAIYLSQQDHDEAMRIVCENNDDKFRTNSIDAAMVAEQVTAAKGCKVSIVATPFEGVTYYSIHNEADKVMKPVGHPTPDLRPLLNKGETELFVVVKPECSFCECLVKNLENILDIHDYTVLEPMVSDADNEFCIENGLIPGSIAYYNGETLESTTIQALDFKVVGLGKWLKGVNYV